MSDRSIGGGEWTVFRWTNRFLEGVAAVVLFLLMAMTCVDVAGRYLFNQPLDGATELTRLMLAVIVFAVLPVVSWREQHVSVDLLDNVFPHRLTNARQLLLNLVSAVAMAGLAHRIWQLAYRARDYGDMTEYLHIPIYPLIFFISILCGLAGALLLGNTVRYLAGRGPLSPTTPR
jgi:TRAP-type C4-dicarboxylate transport system permease small subunit